jgi:hypothetical protein
MPDEDTSPDWLARQLRCCVGHDGCFDPGALSSLANCLEQLKVTRWTKAFIQDLVVQEGPKRDKQKRRKDVIRDLKEDLAVCRARYRYGDPRGLLKNKMQRYEAAIEALEAIENVTWTSIFVLGMAKTRQPWSIAVRLIGYHVREVLRSADKAAGLPPREDFNDEAVTFIFNLLQRHLNSDEAPERKEVVVILKQIAPAKLTRGRPRRK